jgi:uncharacterized protein (DUF1499 family)
MANRIGLLVTIPLFIAAGAAVAAGVFFAVGPERVWERFGPADLGDVDFANLQRRETPNDALACQAEFCAAKADIEAPIFPLAVPDMFRVVDRAVAGEPGLEQVSSDDAQGTLRYVQRSRVMHYPDTINVKVVALPDGSSAVLIYSRSQLGRSDLGVNRARIERWIGLIRSEAQK